MNNLPIVERCENWGACLRLYVPGWNEPSPIGNDCAPLESRCKSDRYRTLAPNPTILLDVDDAKEIESATQALRLYHHTLLKAWYVRAYSPGKCLKFAAEVSGTPRVRYRAFDTDLAMAHSLLLGALALPAVVRKLRARELVREALSLPACILETA